MTGDRYLIVVPHGGTNRSWRERLTTIGRQHCLALTEGRSFLLLAPESPLLLGGPGRAHGAVLGPIYAWGGRTALTDLRDDDAGAVPGARAASLIRHYWGDYVAIIDGDGGPTILRAPFGDLPCYLHRSADATMLASDVALLESVSVEPAIDWQAVALQLIAPDIRRRRTCLANIEELACGERISLGPSPAYETMWSPWRFVGPDKRCDDRSAATERLRKVLLDTVAAQTSDGMPNLVLLSGGINSSAVAAALSAAGREAAALTMVTRDAAGDERAFARVVADHCRFPLAEVVRDPAMVDLTRSEACDLPYPIETSFSQATRAAIRAHAGSSGHRILHGGGGDQIFCSMQSAAPLADLIRARGFDPRIPALTLDLARLANATGGAVARQALARVISRRSAYHWPSNLECLTPMVCAQESEAVSYAWLSPPAGAGSGSAGHVALTLSALGIVQSPTRSTGEPWKAILLSQPVIETCLSIPPWLWFERGRNRAVARRAIEDLLPQGHVWRSGKGAMASFMIEIFDANRSRLRAMIGDGLLVREGLVDREACLKILDARGPIKGNAWARLLQFADVEAWAASW